VGIVDVEQLFDFGNPLRRYFGYIGTGMIDEYGLGFLVPVSIIVPIPVIIVVIAVSRGFTIEKKKSEKNEY
jgi:hypothetical protein